MNTFSWPSLVAFVLLAPLLLIDLFFALEMLVGLRPGKRVAETATKDSVAIVIPAHDEAAGIGATVQALSGALSPGMHLLVVADNCSDETAAVARAAGARVTERHDPDRRGKGFALAHVRAVLRAQPPASVVVLDADCRMDRASLTALTGASQASGRAMQSVNLLRSAPDAAPMVQISTFAFLIKNLVRQRGLQRLARRVHLTGTGMCLPWSVFDQADLATASIVEDLRLGLELAERGMPPGLAEQAFVWSPHAAADQTLGQRRRWEGGFLATMRAVAPGLIGRGLRTGSIGTIAAGLDLAVPPLALFAMVNVAALLLLLLLATTGLISWAPALALGAIGLIAATALGLAWWREGRSVLRPAALVRIPLYALWKLPMYAGLVRKGAPGEWNRTARVHETTNEAP